MAKTGWKGPNEPWDQHSRPRARAALNDARKAGWWLKKSSASAKAWGVITCGDPDLPLNERCSTSILSTSGTRDGSATAEYINDFVGSCPHDRAATSEVDALADAEKLVAAADWCLDAARSLIDAQVHRDLVEDYLEQSEVAANEADDLLAHALAEEELAEGADTAASDAAAAAGTSTSVGPTGLAERARDQAGDAKSLVAGDTSREARMLKNQCDDIRNNARALLAEIRRG
jgi:hypothetical protein